MLRLSRLLPFACAVSAFAAAPSGPALSRAKAALSGLPLRFEANRGQWDAGVRYAARAGGYTLLLGSSGPSVEVPGTGRVDIGLLHSNPAPAIEALDPLPARTDYFHGARANWHTGVANYARVRYRAVYPGIDLIYYGDQNRLEYDFVLQPGADPRAIRMRFRGPGRVSLTSDGDLALDAAGSRILQKRPFIYQDGPDGRRQIAGRYKLAGRDTVAMAVGRYDRTRPLVIDPVVLYCTYIGGSSADEITAVKLGPNGLLYVAGWTTNGELGITGNAYKGYSALTDIFVGVFDTNNGYTPVYFSYLGGGDNDTPNAMDVDSAGIIYLTGSTASTDFPLAGASVQTAAPGNTDAFVVKLDPSQSGGDALVYSTYLGGPEDIDAGNGIVAGRNGMIYVIGTTRSSDFPNTANAYSHVRYGPQDAFMTEIDPASSTPVYSTFYGGENADDGRSIAQAANGNIYFAVSTDSTQLAASRSGPPAHFPDAPGGIDIVLGVLDMTKSGEDSLLWATFFGGSGNDEVRKIALDANGNVLVTGYTLSSDFPVTADAMQPQYAGAGDAFASVVSLANPQSFLLYSTYLGGTDGEVAYDIQPAADGGIYLTGYTLSKDFPTTQDAPYPIWGGGVDVFVTKLKPGVAGSGALQSSTYLGGPGVFVGFGLAVAPNGTLYVGGYGSIGLPTSGNASQYGYGGGYSDGFLVVLGQTPTTTPTSTVTTPASPRPEVMRGEPVRRTIRTR